MARAFWQHKTSGDVFAVELSDDGVAWAAVGPVYYSDITAEYLDNLDVSTEEGATDDAIWINDQACRVIDPDEYFAGETR